jgi:hypothetical protein
MNRSLIQTVFGLAILATCASLAAEQSHQWRTATVISQNLTSDSNTVAVVTGAYSYVWQEVTGGSDSHHFIRLLHDQTVHDQVKFYRDRAWFVILDKEGEKHKFRLVRTATNE